MREGGKIITLRGIVIPVDWDEEGEVIAAALSTHNEEEYLIDHDHMGRKLMEYIHNEVEVRGVVRKKNNKKTITITTCEVIKEQPGNGVTASQERGGIPREGIPFYLSRDGRLRNA
jgi:5S rRNA maturation endonuclease (ribonuclease M5)